MDDLRNDKGQWLVKPEQAHSITSSEEGRELARKRWDGYRAAAVQGVISQAAVLDKNITTGAGAFALVVAKHFSLLMTSEKPRISELVKLRDMLLGKDAADPGDNSQRADMRAGEISAAPAVLMELVAMIEQRQRQAADRARAVDVTSQDVPE